MALIFVTGNEHKFEEVELVLQEFDIGLQRENFDFVEPAVESLEEIALSKAKQAFGEFRSPLIVEDTGLYFEAYEGFPGVNPKWVFESLGFDGLLKLLSGKKRGAFFRTVLCYIDKLNSHRFFDAEWHGKIAKKVSKPNARAMPYNKIFIPEGLKTASVELSLEEHNRLCQRGIVSRKFGKWFKEKSLDDMLDYI